MNYSLPRNESKNKRLIKNKIKTNECTHTSTTTISHNLETTSSPCRLLADSSAASALRHRRRLRHRVGAVVERRHLHSTKLIDHLHHVAHLRPLIRRSRSTSQGNLQKPNHFLFDVFVSHQLQIKNLRRPLLSHHRLNPPGQIQHAAVSTASRPAILHHGWALSGEQLEEKNPK